MDTKSYYVPSSDDKSEYADWYRKVWINNKPSVVPIPDQESSPVLGMSEEEAVCWFSNFQRLNWDDEEMIWALQCAKDFRSFALLVWLVERNEDNNNIKRKSLSYYGWSRNRNTKQMQWKMYQFQTGVAYDSLDGTIDFLFVADPAVSLVRTLTRMHHFWTRQMMAVVNDTRSDKAKNAGIDWSSFKREDLDELLGATSETERKKAWSILQLR